MTPEAGGSPVPRLSVSARRDGQTLPDARRNCTKNWKNPLLLFDQPCARSPEVPGSTNEMWTSRPKALARFASSFTV